MDQDEFCEFFMMPEPRLREEGEIFSDNDTIESQEENRAPPKKKNYANGIEFDFIYRAHEIQMILPKG